MPVIVDTLLYALEIYKWIVIVACVFSFLYAFNVVNASNQFVSMIGNAVFQLTEPVLAPIRRVMPNLGGIDFSPIVLFILIYFVQRALIYSVYG